MRGSARLHLNQHDYKLIIGCQGRQEMGKIPIFTDSERLKVSLDSRFVDLDYSAN